VQPCYLPGVTCQGVKEAGNHPVSAGAGALGRSAAPLRVHALCHEVAAYRP
jgi:hypothetical protein